MVKPENVTAIILCGGLGTRLHSVTNDNVPKPMVNIAGRPFLEYLLDYLLEQGIKKAILAVSHQSDMIIRHFGDKYRQLTIGYSIENQPLGTGGAIKLALQQIQDTKDNSSLVLVLNGDTFSEFNTTSMINTFIETQSTLVMGLKPLDNTDRYGRVKTDRNGKIIDFEEKKSATSGNINVGVYITSKNILSQFPNSENFSFEKDFLEKNTRAINIHSNLVNGYFIDIGIPEDYYRANHYFKQAEISIE